MLYKMTDATSRTYGPYTSIRWGLNVEHESIGEGALCSSAYLHAYTDPRLAVLVDPAHGEYTSYPPVDGPAAQLWEAEGDVELVHADKVGCTRLRTLRQIPLPVLSTEQRVELAIRCAQAVVGDLLPTWSTWAKTWLSCSDRKGRVAAAHAEVAAKAALAEAKALIAETKAARTAMKTTWAWSPTRAARSMRGRRVIGLHFRSAAAAAKAARQWAKDSPVWGSAEAANETAAWAVVAAADTDAAQIDIIAVIDAINTEIEPDAGEKQTRAV